MKRKRGAKAGNKKGKQKQKLLVSDSSPATACDNTEDAQCLDENDDKQLDPRMAVESPLSGPDKSSNVASSVADMVTDASTGKSGHGRVKVKIRTSRPLEAIHTRPDVQAQGDRNVMSPVQDLVMDNREDAYSDGIMSDVQANTTGKSSRKSGSIKIISSRVLATSSTVSQDKHFHSQSSSMQVMCERVPVASDNEKTTDSTTSRKFAQRETTKSSYMESRHNEKELNAALSVIKKVMKMDAAEPFNAPVDPVALGIPDYFDVIDTPMDFGTICNNLENRRKYSNSEDVFNDVQFIWNNCYNYNNKGDYIIDLMKRVKKNFLKYWMAAGLFCGVPSSRSIETSQSHQEKAYLKGKSSKHKRRRGITQHKSGCLCAVCVVRRRRKEREGNSILVGTEIATGDANMLQECKEEENSPTDNIGSEQTSSSLGQSPEPLSNADINEPEQEDMDIVEQHNSGQDELGRQGLNENEMEILDGTDISAPSRLILVENALHDDSSQQSQGQENDSMRAGDLKCNMQDEVALQDRSDLEEKREESSEMLEQIKLYEGSSRQENHSILQICRTLFPKDQRSMWTGPHSLSRRVHVSSARNNLFQAAVAMSFKQ